MNAAQRALARTCMHTKNSELNLPNATNVLEDFLNPLSFFIFFRCAPKCPAPYTRNQAGIWVKVQII